MTLQKKDLLQVSPDVVIKLIAMNDIKLEFNGNTISGSSQTLAVINEFYKQTTFGEGVERLSKTCKSNAQWVGFTREITRLHKCGVLESPEKHKQAIKSHNGKFDSAPVHIRMLNDYERTSKFQKAIREIVTPNDIVVDIGTGTGVLAITAAQAGAKHVYAIERTGMGKIAQQSFAKNGLADKITLIEGKSTEITLPEKATILVSEIIGNDPLDEGILPTTQDAVKRLLTPNAQLIPYQLDLYALPLTIPEKAFMSNVFTETAIETWQKWYNIDFSVLLDITQKQASNISRNAYQLRDWSFLSEPIFLSKINLSTILSSAVESNHIVEMKEDGLLNGILVYFSAQLSNSIELSLHPKEASEKNHWASFIWIPQKTQWVKKGDKVEMNYLFKNASVFELKNL